MQPDSLGLTDIGEVGEGIDGARLGGAGRGDLWAARAKLGNMVAGVARVRAEPNLMERVLPLESGLRQWVLTFPFSWRRRLAQDGALLGRLTRIAVETVLVFYAARAGEEGGLGAKSGAVTAVQKTSSDLRLNPHLHMIALDGTWCEKDGELAWEGLRHLGTSEVGEVLERVVRRMERHLRRSGQLRTLEDEAEADGESDPEGNLAASAVSGQSPPAGPQWVSRLAPLEPRALAYDRPLCASLDGFTLHAATRAGALDPVGREALLHYVLRPPVAQARVEQRSDGLVRITLKKAYTDGTIAVEMDPLSLLCRLATSVPPPRFHTVKYAGVLASASPWRSRLAPPSAQAAAAGDEPGRPAHAGGYRPWAELLARTFAVDVLACPRCQGRMKLLALVKNPAIISRTLATVGRRPRCLGGRPVAVRRTGRAACCALRWPRSAWSSVLTVWCASP